MFAKTVFSVIVKTIRKTIWVYILLLIKKKLTNRISLYKYRRREGYRLLQAPGSWDGQDKVGCQPEDE